MKSIRYKLLIQCFSLSAFYALLCFILSGRQALNLSGAGKFPKDSVKE